MVPVPIVASAAPAASARGTVPMSDTAAPSAALLSRPGQ